MDATTQEQEAKHVEARDHLSRMITSSWTSQAIYAVAKLGTADFLADGPRHIDDLARRSEVDPGALYRLVRALASVGVFKETQPRYFDLTPLAHYLQSDVSGSRRHWAIFCGEESFRTWCDVLYSVRTGLPAFERIFGKSFFDYLEAKPSAAETFNRAMGRTHWNEYLPIASTCDLRSARCVIDVGGGNGSLLAAILNVYPTIRGTLFDLPHVMEAATQQLRAANVLDRCEVVAGTFFESVPLGGDVYILANVLHDWPDDCATAILRTLKDAMHPLARLLVLERLIPEGDEPHSGKLMDLEMLVLVGGRERTRKEYETLLERTGFRLNRTVSLPGVVAILDCGLLT